MAMETLYSLPEQICNKRRNKYTLKTYVSIHIQWKSFGRTVIVPKTRCAYFQYMYDIQLVIPKHSYLNYFLSFQLFHTDEGLQSFALRGSRLGLVSSIILNGRDDMQSIKSAQSILYSEFKTCPLSPLEENNEGWKTNILTQIHTVQI